MKNAVNCIVKISQGYYLTETGITRSLEKAEVFGLSQAFEEIRKNLTARKDMRGLEKIELILVEE